MSKELEAFDKVLDIICCQKHDKQLDQYIDTVEQALLKYEKLCDVFNQLTDIICIHKKYMTKSAQETLCRNSLKLINNRYEVKIND